MAPISIDGLSVSDVTVNGQSVGEITIDTTVVFPATDAIDGTGGGSGSTNDDFYIEDGFDDNKLTNRDNPNDGAFAHPDANEAGDVLIGRFRPEWREFLEGANTRNPNADNGFALIPNPDSTNNEFISIYTKHSGFSIGSWKVDARNNTNVDGNGGYGNATYISIYNTQSSLLSKESNNRVVVIYATLNAEYSFTKVKAGSATRLIVSSENLGTSFNTMRFTRDAFGDLELFLNGTSKGTTNDPFFPENKSINHTNISDAGNGGSRVDYDNLIVQ